MMEKNATPPLRVLIVEDHQDLAENIGDYLESKGHIVDFAMDGIGGLHLALTQSYDVLVLDIMLPGMDGLTLCRRLRRDADNHTPILMLTARDTLADKLGGFDAGTDDYLVKPFALEELAARLTALSKRRAGSLKSVLTVGELEMDTNTRQVRRQGHTIRLNRVGYRILEMLLRHYPNIVTRQALEHHVWADRPPTSDALRSHIYTLRNAVDKPFSPAMIRTIHGVGFQIVDPHEN